MLRLFTAASIVLLASCAGRAPNPVTVSQAQDATMTCEAVHAEIAANTTKISALGSEQGAKVAQNVAAGVAGLFIWPLWFAMDFQGAATKEVAALEARSSYLAGRALHTCAAVAQIQKIAPAAGPSVRPFGGTVYEPHVIVQPSRGPSETPSTPRRVEVINARPPAPAADVPAAVQPGDQCAKYKNTPTESRCRLYVGPNGWQSIPPVGRNAVLDTQLRCAPIRRNLTSYERCISSSEGAS